MQNLSYIYSNGKLMKYVNIEIIHARKYASLTKKKCHCLYPSRMHYMLGSSNIEMGKTQLILSKGAPSF